MKSLSICSSFRRQLAALVLSVLVSACGGGGGSNLAGGVGSGGSGLAEGVVSGFGSLIVAGVEYDDSQASVLTENAQGQSDLSEAKLGQRVRIIQSKAGVADTIQLLPQLRGTASSTQDRQGVFVILGQTVQLILSSDAQNTATIFEGLTSVSAGDELEVHGHWVFDSTRNHSVLIATRVEKLALAADPVLLSGVLRSRSNQVLTLDSALGQTLQSAALPASLTAASLVSAWLPRSALGASPWLATRVIDASPSLADNQRLLLNTQISQRDLAQGEIRVQGMRVQLPAGLGSSAPAIGSMVQIEIVRSGSDLKALVLSQKQSSADMGGTVELKGSVLWPSDISQLSLRGNRVSVAGAVFAASCTGLRAGDKVYLEIKAARPGPGQPLAATSIGCNAQIPGDSVLELSGTLTNLNLGSRTVQVRTNGGILSLVWNDASLLPSNPSALLNRGVEIEYQVINGENRLRKLKPD
ncbi:MAG: hypothetical protein WCK08_05405 [Betaproteobacteria bacterium]